MLIPKITLRVKNNCFFAGLLNRELYRSCDAYIYLGTFLLIQANRRPKEKRKRNYHEQYEE